MNNFKIFSGTSNQPLAEKIAQLLGKPLGKIEIIRFADSEARVRILEKIDSATCFVIASLSNPVDERLIEFCLITNALRENKAGKIIGVIPYIGYTRQDKAHRSGEGISSRVIAKVIETTGVEKIISVDLHSDLAASYFRTPLIQIVGSEIFLPEINKIGKDLVIVAPDKGAEKYSQYVVDKLKVALIIMDKKRNLNKIHTIESINFSGDVKGKVCAIIDDVIVGGGTCIEAAKVLKARGAKRVFVFATHADFIKGTSQRLAGSLIDKIFVSDTIYIPQLSYFPKLKIISAAGVLARSIKPS